MLYGISAVFDQMLFSNDVVFDALDFALDLGALDPGALDSAGAKPLRRTPDRPSSTR